jgi:hypothetical protein
VSRRERFSRRLPLGLSIAAVVVAVLGSTPVGQAAKGLVVPRNSVGTAQLKRNAVTSAKVRNHSLLAADFKRGQIPSGATGPAGPQGPTGPAGAKGDKGDKGDTATTLWGEVRYSPLQLLHGSGITRLSYNGVGLVVASLDRDVSKCAVVATPAALGGWSSAWHGSDAHDVIVYGTDGDNKASDLSFAVFC